MLSQSLLSTRLTECGVTLGGLFVPPETVSTNNDCREIAKSAPDKPILVAADCQTGGRGRQGKSFLSPRGGLYMSLLVPTNCPISAAVGITSCTAVAVCRGIEQVTQKSPGIKWVNDILLDGGKVAGILCESLNDGELSRYAIIGIGINLTAAPEIRDSVIPAAALSTPEDPAEAEALCAAITKELCEMAKTGFDFPSLADEYRSRSVILGREVTFTRNGETNSGVAHSIDENGALWVRTTEGDVKLDSGEISVRMK